MKRGGIFLVLMLVLPVVSAGSFFDGSVWDMLLSGNAVRGYSNKDFELVELMVDKGAQEVLAKVCNRGTIGINHQNVQFASFVLNGQSSVWSYPMSEGYEDTPERRPLTSSTLYIGQCIWLAAPIPAGVAALTATVRVDPEGIFIEDDEENNAKTQVFVLSDAEEPVVSVFVDSSIEEDGGAEEQVEVQQVSREPNAAGMVVVLVLLLVILIFFVVQRRRLLAPKHKPLAH